jgi:hypothetical protein
VASVLPASAQGGGGCAEADIRRSFDHLVGTGE